MLDNQGVTSQITMYNLDESLHKTKDCPVIELTTDWKTKSRGGCSIMKNDTHHALFESQKAGEQYKITLSNRYTEPRAKNLVRNESKGRAYNPIAQNILSQNFMNDS